jgi:hypothetical protein
MQHAHGCVWIDHRQARIFGIFRRHGKFFHALRGIAVQLAASLLLLESRANLIAVRRV